MSKAALVTKALAKILKATGANQRVYPDMWRGRAAPFVKTVGDLVRLPEKEFRNVKGVGLGVLERQLLGRYLPRTQRVQIDPFKRGQLVGNTTRHEFAHVRQYTGGEPSEQLLLEYQALARSKQHGKPVSYWHEPIEIHARAVEYSKHPFEEAYSKSLNALLDDIASTRLGALNERLPLIDRSMRMRVREGLIGLGAGTLALKAREGQAEGAKMSDQSAPVEKYKLTKEQVSFVKNMDKLHKIRKVLKQGIQYEMSRLGALQRLSEGFDLKAKEMLSQVPEGADQLVQQPEIDPRIHY